jgi:hypothetical protein
MEGLRNKSRKMEMEQSVLASRTTAACEEDWKMLWWSERTKGLLLGFGANNKKKITYATQNCPRSI